VAAGGDGAALAGGIARERIGEEDGVDREFGQKNMKDVSAKLPVWRLNMDGESSKDTFTKLPG
jgi:hypothetical protein